jgi:RNA-binding protein
MNFLGTVEEIASDGKIIVRCETTPEIGDTVFDQRQTRIGTVKRVFGPVDGPYASVSPTGTADGNIRGKKLYHEGEMQNGKGKRRYRRD